MTVTADISISLDGFAAGPNQSEDQPFGEGVDERLTTWMFDHAEENRAERDAILDAGAYIMGRNMFGPIRGEWDRDWTGWWGPEPPYHAPVFVLTHHPREPLEMEGGTTFVFVTDGPESALAQARRAAGDGRVSIAGGAATLNQYLSLGAVDELRLHVVPITLGAGERVFDGAAGLTFDIPRIRPTEHVVHVTLRLPGR
ncbi:MAG TPA: dihydrofolate reductase family protein [Mycobacterium sp.]|nr:dihydrofolate reductase family protein [Mycobacterium sp.]